MNSARPFFDTASPGTVSDGAARWLASGLAEAGLVPGGAPLALEARIIGADRGFTGAIARVGWRVDDGRDDARRGTVIVKLPDATADFLRCEREVLFYRHLAGAVAVEIPRFHFAEVDRASSFVALVLEDVPGRDGDAHAGCAPAEAEAIVRGIAAMHARWWRDPRLEQHAWLPRWGTGQAGVERPHRRRAERFRRRIGPFLGWYGRGADPGLVDLIERLAGDFERILETIERLPVTLIHADLHLDNVIFGAGNGFVLLDWQSVSSGPGTYDLARLLTGALVGAEAHAAIPDLIALYRATLLDAGVAAADLARLDEDLNAMHLRVLAGFVSGYGGRAPETLTPREVAMIERSASEDGMGGALRAAGVVV